MKKLIPASLSTMMLLMMSCNASASQEKTLDDLMKYCSENNQKIFYDKLEVEYPSFAFQKAKLRVEILNWKNIQKDVCIQHEVVPLEKNSTFYRIPKHVKVSEEDNEIEITVDATRYSRKRRKAHLIALNLNDFDSASNYHVENLVYFGKERDFPDGYAKRLFDKKIFEMRIPNRETGTITLDLVKGSLERGDEEHKTVTIHVINRAVSN